MADNNALAGYVSELEEIAGERETLNERSKDIYDALREAGYNAKAVRQIVRERRMDADALEAYNDTLDEYREALGQLAGTPLGEAGAPRMHAVS